MSIIVKQIASAIGISPVSRGEHTFLIRLNDANDFIAECAKQHVVVLGIDVFDLVPEGIKPDMDLMADFSSLNELPKSEQSVRSIAEAKAFLSIIPLGERVLYFEILLK